MKGAEGKNWKKGREGGRERRRKGRRKKEGKEMRPAGKRTPLWDHLAIKQ